MDSLLACGDESQPEVHRLKGFVICVYILMALCHAKTVGGLRCLTCYETIGVILIGGCRGDACEQVLMLRLREQNLVEILVILCIIGIGIPVGWGLLRSQH